VSSLQLAHVLVAISLLVASAQFVGWLFARLRQPAVIGEIVGGLLLGPTLLGTVAPGTFSRLFPSSGPTASVLSALAELGLILLMFCSGMELRSAFQRCDRRLVSSIAVAGMVFPFALGLVLVHVAGVGRLSGPAHDDVAVVVVFSLAIAVTSIPVISRIMFDLGILHTRFARVVLAVAVVEDTVVYVVLALAVGASAASSAPVAHALGVAAGTSAQVVLHVVMTLGVMVTLLVVVPRILAVLRPARSSVTAVGAPLTSDIVVLLLVSAGCLMLGVNPMLGAFGAGIATARSAGTQVVAARSALRDFSFAFFIPLYFASVGLKLDLVHHFDPVFFLWFAVAASIAKTLSVLAGGIVGGAGRRSATSLAVAMNARGGPGIVLATVALQAGVVNESFYSALVMLAIVTSLAAGAWLGRLVRTGRLDELATDVVPDVSPEEPEDSKEEVAANGTLRPAGRAREALLTSMPPGLI
jgi:Kef-type K+ transport system membrane component KefB